MSRLTNRTARLRQLEELLLLSPAGLSVAELSSQLLVNRRTVYRDIDFLSEQGVPLWQDGGRFGLNRTRYLATVRLSYQEAMALVLAGLLLARTLDERNPHVIAALRRLATTLPDIPAAHLKRAAERVEGYRYNSTQVAILETIAEGWGSGRKVKIGYRSPKSGELRYRVIDPYALEPTASGIYIICHDKWADAMRTFKLARLESAQLTDETYTIPSDFDPEAHLASSWGIMSGEQVSQVVLGFTAAARPFVVERQWHPSQQIEDTPDGGCLLQVQVSEPLEMQPWIRSWGAQVEVLAPEWLRERIADELQQAAERYRTPAMVAAGEHPHPLTPSPSRGKGNVFENSGVGGGGAAPNTRISE
jgi:predicted DNA-binding transcriptional regulator YafY